VQTPSLSGEEDEVAGLIREEMNSLGFDRTWTDRAGNVGGLIRGSGAGPVVVLEGHMDTVPPGRAEEWGVDPFSGEVRDGWLYGRGSVDMKGAIAAMVHSASLLKSPNADVYMAFVVHEEDQEGFGIRVFLEEAGIKPNLVVLGEATRLNVAVGHRGRVEIMLSARGRTAHSSMPDLGDSALYKLVEALVRLRGISEELPEHEVLGRSSAAPVAIRCSPGVIPVIPDSCEALLDYRMVPGETLESILSRMRSLRPGVEASVVTKTIRCYTGLEERVRAYFPAWYMPSEFAELVAGELGGELMTWRFGTDGSHTAGEAGILTIGYGPGDETLAHRPNERVRVADLRAAAKGYAKIVRLAEAHLPRGSGRS